MSNVSIEQPDWHYIADILDLEEAEESDLSVEWEDIFNKADKIFVEAHPALKGLLRIDSSPQNPPSTSRKCPSISPKHFTKKESSRKFSPRTVTSRTTKKSRQLTSKYKGVCWYRRTGKWVVQIKYNGSYRHLGYFNDERQAGCAYLAALKKYTQ